MRTVRVGRARCGAGATVAGLALAIGACGANEDVPPDSTPRSTPIRVTVGGNTFDFPQAEVTNSVGLPVDGQATVTATFRTAAFDRCSGGAGLDASASRATMTAYLPQRVGRYTLPAGAITFRNGSITDMVTSGTLDITRVDGRTIEGWFNAAWGSIGSERLQGSFTVDSCGYIGTDLMTFNGCPVPAEPQTGPYVPRLYAVSRAGRVLLASSNYTATVYKPQISGTTCEYVVDTSYGTGGTITFRTHFFQSAWDDAERLYVTTERDFNNTETGAFYRVTPGQPLESCTNNAMPIASIVDQMPDEMRVLPDGSRAFFYWRAVGEWTLDLADPSLGPRDLACNFVTTYDDVSRYTSATSMSAAGLLFVQMVQGRWRAVETDALLSPLRIFGGSPSGKGEQGMQDARYLLSRCPVGYCALGDPPLTMKMFRADGTFIQLLRLQGVVSGFPWAVYLGPGTGGTAWLRAAQSDTTGTSETGTIHTVYRLAAKP